MLEPPHVEYCRHIVEWGERIPRLIGHMSYEEFARNEAVHLAVWKCVEVLGEASVNILKVAPHFEMKHPRLQLRYAYLMRNRLTHGYTTVDLFVLWNTAKNDTPDMVAEARVIVAYGGR